jgi:hypothetical protein
LVWFFPAFPTVDGSTHSLTAKLILDGFTGDPDPNIAVGSYWVPNALGHYALVALQLLLSPATAERALLFLILFGMGVGLFRLCQACGNRMPWAALLVLPFSYNFLLVMGFYNFLLGMVLALFVLAYAFRRDHPVGWTWAIFLVGSLVVLWCHAMAFFFLALVVAMHRSLLEIPRLANKAERFTALRAMTRTALLLLPGTILFFIFSSGQDTRWGTVNMDQNFKDLIDLRVLVLYAFDLERPYVLFITAMLALLLIRSFQECSTVSMSTLLKQPVTALFFSALLLLLLYFILPDSTGYASFISQRLQLMFFLLLIGWISVQLPYDRWSFAFLLVFLGVHFMRLKYMRHLMKPLAEQAMAIEDASLALPPGTNVLPINFEPEWLLGHQATQLGLYNDLHVLENYECSMGYFPLIWRKDLPSPLYWHLMTATDRQCFEWLKDYVDAKETPAMDQIALIGPVDSASCKAQNVLPILAAHYRQTFDNGYVRVYSLKK